MWVVYVDGLPVKKYKYKIQANIYCYLKGFVYSGLGDFYNKEIKALDSRVRIERENLDED